MPLSVATTCPSCGGGLEFEHGSNAVRCRYCGSSHLVTGSGRVLSYVIPEKLDGRAAAGLALAKLRERGGTWEVREATLFFVPFHHFRGQDLFWTVGEEVVSEGSGGSDSPRPGLFGRFTDDSGDDAGYASPRITEKRFALSTRHIDRTLPALEAAGLNVCSLGLRPEVLKLSLFEKDALLRRGMISPAGAAGDGIEQQGYAPVRPEGIVARSVIHRTRSLIHFPFWIIEAAESGREGTTLVVVDGVSGDVTAADAPAALLDRLVDMGKGRVETVGLRPLTCPECGGDLPVRERDVVFFCGGCGKAWHLQGTELRQVPFTALPDSGSGKATEYFPFWVIGARVVSGGESIADKHGLTRLAPGIRVPREEDKQVPLRFFAPAFEIGNLNILARLAANFTRTQPVWQPERLERGAVVARGCLISPDDALELSRLILFTLVPKGNKRALKFALEARVEVNAAELVLVPFARAGADYTNALLGQSVPVAALRE